MAIEPMDAPPKAPMTPTQKKVAVGGGLAATGIALAIGLIAPWEGKRNDPYLDIVKVPTVCYGETQVKMRRYTDAECKEMLQESVASRYAPPVLKCVPGLAERPYQLAAAISLAYNIGHGGFCKSTAARLFRDGDWRGGCKAIGRYNMAGGKVVRGLQNRRNDEIKLCMTGL